VTIKMTITKALAVVLAFSAASCGEYVESGRSPARIVISALEAASGASSTQTYSTATLLSDVVTLISTPEPRCSAAAPCSSLFNDYGRVTMSLVLRDQGVPGLTSTPSNLNQVTFTRYRVEYMRTDGRRVQGVDVPYAFDSGVTFTVPAQGTVIASFELVRHTAKEEAPLRPLVTNPDVISTIAQVTFYGRDLAGNDVTASGSIGVNFGNFADPTN
jgi:hypothetical protein